MRLRLVFCRSRCRCRCRCLLWQSTCTHKFTSSAEVSMLWHASKCTRYVLNISSDFQNDRCCFFSRSSCPLRNDTTNHILDRDRILCAVVHQRESERERERVRKKNLKPSIDYCIATCGPIGDKEMSSPFFDKMSFFPPYKLQWIKSAYGRIVVLLN